MLGKLELLVKAAYQFVDKRFTVVCDEIPRHSVSEMMRVRIKPTSFSFLTSFKAIASTHLEK